MVNKESLAYELGVLLFNLTSDNKHVFSDNYDRIGNFVGIMNTLYGEIDLKNIKCGFLTEAQNRNIDEGEAEELFEKAKSK